MGGLPLLPPLPPVDDLGYYVNNNIFTFKTDELYPM